MSERTTLDNALLFLVLTLFLTGCAQESEIETEDSVSLLDDVSEIKS